MNERTRADISARDLALLERARLLAAAHHPHPNPRVGCVLVNRNGDTIAEGAHAAAGAAHAEVMAIEAAMEPTRGGTAYVTLEPCAHTGRTPPCVNALIDAGIARVVIGAVDPDVRVSGSGISALRSAGIDVITEFAELDAYSVDPGYFHHRTTGRPYVTLKLAATLDGQTAGADGTSQWITSADARRDVHTLRSRSDIVMVGAGTVIADDPSLDVRLVDVVGRQPTPAIIVGSRPIPRDARILERSPLIFGTDDRNGALAYPGADGVDLDAVMKHLGAEGFIDVLIEGGHRLAETAWRLRLVDRVVIYYGATIAGGSGVPMFGGAFETLASSRPVDIVDVRRIGADVRLEAVPQEVA